MAYQIETKERAINLRKRGWSLNEIEKELKISKSTISGWVSDTKLSDVATRRLLSRIQKGQVIAAENKKKKTRLSLDKYFSEGRDLVREIKIDGNLSLLLCSMLYWCEGAKDVYSGVRFTNSDYRLVKKFLFLFNKSFNLDKSKFRICLHLHKYHNVNDLLEFWSKATGIPIKQFIKPFQKKNTGKRIKSDYKGCADIRYHDTVVARKLLMTAKAFLETDGGYGEIGIMTLSKSVVPGSNPGIPAKD